MEKNEMNPSLRFIWRPLLIFIFLMTLYQTLIYGQILPSSEGLSIQQSNRIKAEQYVYQNPANYQMVMTGSSRAAKIEATYFNYKVANLAMRGGSTQTGLAIIQKNKSHPPVVLAEINGTILNQTDQKLLDSLYHPFLYLVRSTLSMFRQEYQPVSVFIQVLRNWLSEKKGLTAEKMELQQIANPNIVNQRVQISLQERINPLSEDQQQKIRQAAESIKQQIRQLNQQGVKVVLFDVPGDPRVDQSVQVQQERQLIRELFPRSEFDWLPEAPAKDWQTTDGVHLIRSEAKDYAVFIEKNLFGAHLSLTEH